MPSQRGLGGYGFKFLLQPHILLRSAPDKRFQMVRSDRILLLGNKAFEEWIKFVQISKAEQIESECNLCWPKLQKNSNGFPSGFGFGLRDWICGSRILESSYWRTYCVLILLNSGWKIREAKFSINIGSFWDPLIPPPPLSLFIYLSPRK